MCSAIEATPPAGLVSATGISVPFLRPLVSDLELRVLFRDSAWRWRLGATDVVELWTGAKLLGSIPGGLVTDIIADYINRLAILHHFEAKLKASALDPPEGPTRQVRRDRREARRKPLRKAL